MDTTEYRYEWLREFVIKRQFLIGVLIDQKTYAGLKDRTIVAIGDDAYLRGFVDGWRSAKEQDIHVTLVR